MVPPASDWLELSVGAGREAVDWVCTALAGAGYRDAVEIVETPSGPRELAVRAYLPAADGALRARVLEALAPLRRIDLIDEPRLEAADGRPAASAARLLLVRTERPLEVRVPASLAFGSGLHPATVASLRLIERHAVPGGRALDLGSGSGVLSVALAKLGMRVLALDNDPIAVAATRETVRVNRVEGLVAVAHGSLGRGAALGHWLGAPTADPTPSVEPGRGYDLIAANIFARVHAELAADYFDALRPGGVLITAGFEDEQESQVAEALTDAGLSPLAGETRERHVALAHRRAIPGDPSDPARV